MSKLGSISGNCGNCDEKFEAEFWSSVNINSDPALKQKLLDYELNVFECPKCKLKSLIPRDFLYHDMSKRLWLQLTFSKDVDDSLNQQNELLNEMKELTGNIGKLMSVDYTRRLMTSYEQLVEKVLIFDKGLDDRTLELIKLVLQITNRAKGKDIDDCLYFTDLMNHPDNPEMKIIVFNNEWYAPFEEWYVAMKKTVDSVILHQGDKMHLVDKSFAIDLYEYLQTQNA